MLEIFPVYAVVAVFFFVALNINVIRNRRKYGVSLGDGNNENLIRARSIYSNFHEFVTMFLLLLLAAEFANVADWLLHTMAIVFFVTRLIHVYAITQKKAIARVVAIAASQTVLIVIAIGIVFKLI